MKYILILHLAGTLFTYAAMWNSDWRKKAHDEGHLIKYIINGLVIGLLWEPMIIFVMLKK